jgi:hypothetical protein
LLTSFRIITTVTIGIFWGLLGLILGSFWDVTRPHENRAPRLSAA